MTSHEERLGAVAGRRDGAEPGDGLQRTALAAGSLLGALAMSSCCIVPLALFSVGVTSAWLGNLASLYPYRWLFLAATAGFLAAGFYKTYRRRPSAGCEEVAACARPWSERAQRAALWTASVLALAALAYPYAAPLLLGT